MYTNISSYLTILFRALSGTIVHPTKSSAQLGEQAFLSGLDIWDIIAIALSVIACMISIVARKPAKRGRSHSPFTNQTQTQSNSSQDVYDPLWNRFKKKQDDFEMQLDRLKFQLTTHINEACETLPETNNYASGLQQSSIVIKYAKTADGNAFAVDALSDVQDNKKIYELTIQSADTGILGLPQTKRRNYSHWRTQITISVVPAITVLFQPITAPSLLTLPAGLNVAAING